MGDLLSRAAWLAELADTTWVCPSCRKQRIGIQQSSEGFLVAVCPCKPHTQLVFSWVTGTWRDRRYHYKVVE